MGRDQVIEAYIQQLLTWEKPLTQTTLATIAEDVGINQAELDAIYLQAQAHVTRGRSYMEFDHLDGAIEELTQAAALQPIDLSVLHTLANAYNLRYNRQTDPADRQRAILVAKRCLELKPDDKEALVLISFLEHKPPQPKVDSNHFTKKRLGILAGSVFALSLAVAGIRQLPLFSSRVLSGPAPGTVVPGSAIYDANDPVTTRLASATTTTTNPQQLPKVEIPVSFDHSGLVFEARLSRLSSSDNAPYYTMHGVLINESDQELRKLRLNVEFLDKKEAVIATSTIDAISDRNAYIRPGDTHAFHFKNKTAPGLDSVRLTLTNLEQVTARNTYVPPTPINYIWASAEPEDIRFELASRSEALEGIKEPALIAVTVNGADPQPPAPEPNDGDDEPAADPGPRSAQRSDFNAEWVIINTGETVISSLKLKAEFYDKNNRRLQNEDVFAIGNDDAFLLPGETRPFRVMESISANYERYKITVLEAN